MARISKVEACMLCGMMPCECNKPAAKAPVKAAIKKAAAKPTVQQPVEEKPKSNIRDAMIAAIKVAPDEIDTETKAAIVTLAAADMLCRDDRLKYKGFIEGPEAIRVRARAWKERRNELAEKS